MQSCTRTEDKIICYSAELLIVPRGRGRVEVEILNTSPVTLLYPSTFLHIQIINYVLHFSILFPSTVPKNEGDTDQRPADSTYTSTFPYHPFPPSVLPSFSTFSQPTHPPPPPSYFPICLSSFPPPDASLNTFPPFPFYPSSFITLSQQWHYYGQPDATSGFVSSTFFFSSRVPPFHIVTRTFLPSVQPHLRFPTFCTFFLPVWQLR